MNQLILFGIIILVALILLGIITGESQQADKLLSNVINSRNNIEGFGPMTASLADVSSGSSTLYNWGITDTIINNTPQTYCEEENQTQPPPQQTCIKRSQTTNNTSNDQYLNTCKNCDITLNKNIDKYVLKSSIKPHTNMNNYILKSEIPSCPTVNMDKYILKSEIPICPNMDQYILKSEIPSCPTCPTCKTCPTCPTCLTCPECSEQETCKKIYDYNITEHPEFNNFVSKSECENTVKTAIDSYTKNNNQPIKQEQTSEESCEPSQLLSNNISKYGMYAAFNNFLEKS
jgi:hypothetical protein